MVAKGKAGETKIEILKGQDAEDKVLEYIKRMNRPFGAVDVAANLKGAVPKTATQKILVALAEKGDVVQKAYGKMTFFVANQSKLEDMPTEKLKTLESEYKAFEETHKSLTSELKAANAELTQLKVTPTDEELQTEVLDINKAIKKSIAHLEPLRSGTSLVSADELAQLDREWMKWRVEWVKRRKIFSSFWALATDALPPPEATALHEDLGLEMDSQEHNALEKGSLVLSTGSVLGKRRR